MESSSKDIEKIQNKATAGQSSSSDENYQSRNNNNNDERLRKIFDIVSGWIRDRRQPPQPLDSNKTTKTTTKTPSVEDKLRLYGLYKHVTVGKCSRNWSDTPSMLRVEAYAKYQAWLACYDMTESQAMQEYLQLASSQSEWLREECDKLWQRQQRENTTGGGGATVKSSSSAGGGGILEQLDEAKKTANGGRVMIGSSVESTDEKVIASMGAPSSSSSSRTKDSIECCSSRRAEQSAHSSTRITRPSSFWGQGLIPRGQLDISYRTLIWAAWNCLVCESSMNQCHALEREISNLWNQAAHQPVENDHHDDHCPSPHRPAVVGLSLRSLLDLFLLAKQYPPGSEIIVAPAINVPGMLKVLEHHQIQVVGVDLPAPPKQDTSSSTERCPIRVDCNALRDSISSRTVAILVVHAFGMVCTTEEDWDELQLLAFEKKLDLLEDCAQVYSGLDQGGWGRGGYCGSPKAHLSFFSFGLIKTATAVGGGIALVRDLKLANTMDRLQWSTFARQSKWNYLQRILKAVLFRLLSHNPYIYFVVYWVLTTLLARNGDEICESWLRSFSPSLTMHSFLEQIRQKPCSQLVAVLLSQLQETTTQARVRQRAQRARQILSQLEDSNPDLVVLDPNALPEDAKQTTTTRGTFWLLPIRYSAATRRSLDESIRAVGFDVSRSSSQLLCVSSTEKCPRAAGLMKDILYLPVTSPLLSSHNAQRDLCDALLSCIQIDTVSNKPFVQRRGQEATIWGSSLWYGLSATGLYYFRGTITLLVPTLATVLCLVAGCAWFIHWSVADFYVNHSKAFAKYCWLLVDEDDSRASHRRDTGKDRPDTPKVIEAIPCLELPEIEPGHDGKTVLLTGATGFIGSMLLHDLLKYRKKLNLTKIIVLCRGKKGEFASRRIKALLSQRIFSFPPTQEVDEIVEAVQGTVTEHDLGLSAKDRARLLEDSSITHIFHCAASVNFTQPLDKAARCNISAPLAVQRLASEISASSSNNDPITFVHLSTAFVHGSMTGSRSSPLGERLFRLNPYDPYEVYKSMLGSQYLASKCYNEFGFPNTYTFSKCVCENLLTAPSTTSNVKTLIVRPSIVGPAVQYPFEAWCGNKPSTFVAAACLYLNFQWNLWYFGPQTVPCIPVDVLSRYILRKAWGDNDNDDRGNHSGKTINGFHKSIPSSNGTPPRTDLPPKTPHDSSFSIHNVSWDVRSPPTAEFSWLDLAIVVTHLGVFMRYFSRFTVYIGLFATKTLLPRLKPGRNLFRRLHSVLVVGPFKLALRASEIAGFDFSKAQKVLPFLDLPVLFFSFSTSSYFFSSELVAPSVFVGDRYAFQSAVAAHEFSKELTRRGNGRDCRLARNYSIGGAGNMVSSSAMVFLWAFGQPRGRVVERIAAWFLSILLRTVCTDVTVDVESFSRSLHLTRPSEDGRRKLLLAPTHRSFFDFLLVSYLCFSIPELQIDLPVIATAAEFRNLPLIAWIIPLFRMFYVLRGRGQAGLELTSKALSQYLKDDKPFVLEMYVEGTRSRDRRFVPAKTGLIRWIQDSEPGCIVIPITINYERIPEQEALSAEVRDGISRGLNLTGVISWLKVRGPLPIGPVPRIALTSHILLLS